MVVYNSASIYIESATSLRDKITRISAIITALEDTALRAAAGEDIEEYWLDDGQTKIKTVTRGLDKITASIQAFEKLKQMYVNRLNGRMIRLSDSRNFI
jgi:predicted translin family RNA/ssDNA-binding protein